MSNFPYRRINLYGGPGTGKSTTAAIIFANLKQITLEQQFRTEHCQEYVKNWAYLKRDIAPMDQVYIWAKQMHRESVPLDNGVDVIVTDSPLLLGCCYALKYECPGANGLLSICSEYEKTYPGIHIFLRRGDREYVAHGRYQDKERAMEMDEYIENALKLHQPNYIALDYNDRDAIMSHILSQLGIENVANVSV